MKNIYEAINVVNKSHPVGSFAGGVLVISEDCSVP
jgi:hypothetical protein